jgi:16S rRNA (adenine1518-N6/adenine1519-N6)-dimethyltransferase
LVVGNLPYYITSPILRKFFSDDVRWCWSDDLWWYSGRFAGGIFMVQDEVAQKLASDVKKKSYLRWLLNYAYEVKYLKWVPAKCFKPAPKVKSALIQLTINNLQLTIKFETLIQFLDLYSAYSRKTLGAISTMLTKKWTNIFSIPENLKKKRLEELKREELEEILK